PGTSTTSTTSTECAGYARAREGMPRLRVRRRTSRLHLPAKTRPHVRNQRSHHQMRARRTIRECTIPGHVSAETHSAQLTRLNNEVDRLKAENLALRALIGNTTKRDTEL